MDKQITVYLYNGILFGNENKWTTDAFNNMDEAKIVMLNKNSQTQKSKCCTVPFYDILEKQKQQIVTESICMSQMCSTGGVDLYRQEGTFWDNGSVLYLNNGETTQLCIPVKIHQIAHLKWAYIIVCKWFLSKVDFLKVYA